ncbi:MAG: ParA family protein [Jaaginema sp. PMC 1080.18]|nr:ParA family protein [Jaaginema sp. PMC 1080.18]
MKLLTWLDVRRHIRKQTSFGHTMPSGIIRIGCYSDALEVYISNQESEPTAENHIKQWFGSWYQEDAKVIKLDVGNADLPVEFLVEEFSNETSNCVKPFWAEIAYADENDNESPLLKLPKPYSKNDPQLVAFYSFKGGVGRTLHLVTHVLALIEKAKESNKSINILVIDADLEAPGITYWQRLENNRATISFLDFLEVYNSASVNIEESLAFLAKETKKSLQQEGKSKIYTIPACLEDEELLDTPILPEHIVRNMQSSWQLSDALISLGKAIEVDYVFIDLRSGLSEISSPILFDSRIQRFIVTTTNKQSVSGSSLVLKQLSHAAPTEDKVKNEEYYDPVVIVSFLTQILKNNPNFDKALSEFQTAYVNYQDGNSYETRLEMKETDFYEKLLYINSWEDAQVELSGTNLMKVAKEWATNQIEAIQSSKLASSQESNEIALSKVNRLKEICEKYEYAESGDGEELLVTEPLRNLANTFRDSLPNVISIGLKGAGKTFNYIQLSRLKNWNTFIKKIAVDSNDTNEVIYLYPLLQSRNLRGKATELIDSAREEVRTALDNRLSVFSHTALIGDIEKHLDNDNFSKQDWTQFWIGKIAETSGYILENEEEHEISLKKIDVFLKNKNTKIVYLFDGLEDVFPLISSKADQKAAIEALIRLPEQISEIRNSNIGLIVFIRRDYVRYVIEQNFAQFENLYKSYNLFWDADSFLRLVLWICKQSSIDLVEDSEIYTLSSQELINRLEKLWGKKLGSDASKEAYTANWIFAALTDFKGRLQARDIVRFLHYAAEETTEKAQEVQQAKWSSDRLLPPQAIRRALEPCSSKKVSEAKEEYAEFSDWVDNLPPSQHLRVPFTVEDFDTLNIDKRQLTILEDMGVLYEDKSVDISRYYMPEIFRTGLNFTLDKGARPRVVVLKRKALGIRLR